ncbi:MAG: sulfite exporter TauE/SafE family protein [Deltaproteobacteria bacterium]|nr:sulfite exporter TauE/SafE family protein [Deltaproteobacteria bacterium]
MHFPVSGVDVPIWVPPVVSFVISFFTSTGGVSGAFLLLPFQASVLHFDTPAVSPTNLVYNVVAIPSGIYRYIKEGRMAWPLTWVVVIGTLPGVVIGAFLRVGPFKDFATFKVFVGLVLLYIGLRMAWDMLPRAKKGREKSKEAERKFNERFAEIRRSADKDQKLEGIKTLSFTLTSISYEFYGEVFTFSTWGIFALSFFVGIIGGIYGIGGGAIIAPFFVAVFKLPVYTVAGAALSGTFITSVFGVIFYQFALPWFTPSYVPVRPDLLLGLLFGIGGLGGIYCGARLQKYLPANVIKWILAFFILLVAAKYLLG